MAVFTLKLNLPATAFISPRAVIATSIKGKKVILVMRETPWRLGKEHTFNFLLLIESGHLDFGTADRTEIDVTRWLSDAQDFLFEHIYEISAHLTRDASHQNVTKMPPRKSSYFFPPHTTLMSEGRKQLNSRRSCSLSLSNNAIINPGLQFL